MPDTRLQRFDADFLQNPLQVLVAPILDDDPALLGRMKYGHPGAEPAGELPFYMVYGGGILRG